MMLLLKETKGRVKTLVKSLSYLHQGTAVEGNFSKLMVKLALKERAKELELTEI